MDLKIPTWTFSLILVVLAFVFMFDGSASASNLNEETLRNENQAAVSSAKTEKILFAPLIADPRWPHFSIAYNYYIHDKELKNVGSTSFGATMPLYRGTAPFEGEWEFGIQAAVFAIFDLDSDSTDLINADYWVGLPVSYRRGALSGLFRLFHQSSHLGDEFLLRNRVKRINLSYESIDLKISYDLNESFRIYGGPGYLIRKDPGDLEPWSVQYGLEYRGKRMYLNGLLKPVAAANFETRQENDGHTDMTLRAGTEIRLKITQTVGHVMQILIEYFNGNSPNGQFYERSIRYVGIGAHFYF